MKNTKGLLFLVVVLALVFFYVKGNFNKTVVEEKGIFTIFYIDEVINGRGLPQVSFHYFYDGTKFEGKYPCTSVSLNEMDGNKIFGKVIPYTDDYFTCCYCEVPSNLKAPSKGWATIPQEYCTKKEDKCF